jgi:hypothetical protein
MPRPIVRRNDFGWTAEVPLRGLLGRKCQNQALQLLLIVLAFVTVVAWCATVGSAEVLWGLRVGCPLAAVGVSYLLYTMLTKPERFPDLLRERAGTYFEKDGLCFAPVLETTPTGACELAVYFQNRHEGRAIARIQMLPPLRTLRLKRHDLPARTLSIQCPGGAFGVARVPFPIPARYQGQRMTFELGADVKYPEGRGDLQRFRSGVRVGSSREMNAGHQFLTALVMLPLAVLATSRAASATLTLPQGVFETNAADGGASSEIIWWPELLEAEAPALPRRQAA